MSLNFTKIAFDHHYTLKCFPCSDDAQTVTNEMFSLEPENKGNFGEDSFGNKTLIGSVDNEHNDFVLRVEGDVRTGISEGRKAYDNVLVKYRYQSRYTMPGDKIRSYHDSFDRSGKSNFEIALMYMNSLYADMIYLPGSTNINTGAEDALMNRRGVCQDYAHILLSLLRLDGIPARYVVGMMIGEGASHAWVEVENNGIWYGVDPTNGKLTDDEYIYISSGRDAYDCQMNKGVLRGGGSQCQSVSVMVNEIYQ